MASQPSWLSLFGQFEWGEWLVMAQLLHLLHQRLNLDDFNLRFRLSLVASRIEYFLHCIVLFDGSCMHLKQIPAVGAAHLLVDLQYGLTGLSR